MSPLGDHDIDVTGCSNGELENIFLPKLSHTFFEVNENSTVV
jgi:hypothetical protein